MTPEEEIADLKRRLAEAEKALERVAGPAERQARSQIAREALAKIRGNDA